MGPRLVSRGNDTAKRPGVNGHHPLQWGHGLLAVEIRLRGQGVPYPIELQWGHGLLAVEICPIESIRRSFIDRASMGPRLVSRGNWCSSNRCTTQVYSFNGATAC